MALIRAFDHRPGGRVALRTEVECGWRVGEAGGKRLLHLETYGSEARDIPGKVSQSLELDIDGARELQRILRAAFPELAS
jgi:hypothetical protein